MSGKELLRRLFFEYMVKWRLNDYRKCALFYKNNILCGISDV